MSGVHSRWWAEAYDVKARRNRDGATVCVARINPECELSHDEELVIVRAVVAVPKMLAALRLAEAAMGGMDAANRVREVLAEVEGRA